MGFPVGDLLGGKHLDSCTSTHILIVVFAGRVFNDLGSWAQWTNPKSVFFDILLPHDLAYDATSMHMVNAWLLNLGAKIHVESTWILAIKANIFIKNTNNPIFLLMCIIDQVCFEC